MIDNVERNKALVRAHYEATVNRFDPDAIDEQVGDEFFDHAAGERLGPEGVKKHIRGLQAVFPDLRVTIDDMIAEDDRVGVRATWRGTHEGDFREVPASRQPVEFTGMVFWRISDNNIVERWASVDVLGPVRRAAEDGAPEFSNPTRSPTPNDSSLTFAPIARRKPPHKNEAIKG